MPQFSLTVVPTLVQGLRCVVENHEIPENKGLPITNHNLRIGLYYIKYFIKKTEKAFNLKDCANDKS